tara:strand:+ start:601 stop:1239 length:639 start_codon:yes stop_codon:yes gene_type:complete
MLDNRFEKCEKVFTLGYHVGQFKMPKEYVDLLNVNFDEHLRKKSLPSHSKSLAGEVKDEWNVTNILNKAVLEFFNGCVQTYIANTSQKHHARGYTLYMNSCWINDQVENEYNPLHIHHGRGPLGLSSVLFLRVPESITNAKSTNPSEEPKDGRLEFISQMGDVYGNPTALITPKVGDLYIFPYNLHHTVYPFKGQGIRRSLSFNVDTPLNNG